MGSKAMMLRNGLGTILLRETSRATHFYDLMSGSAAVSWFIAERQPVRVLSSDIQTFSEFLARAVVGRTRPVSAERIWREWITRATDNREIERPCVELTVEQARDAAGRSSDPLVRAYGGYYYSALQAWQLAVLRRAAPREEPDRSIALGSLIRAASRCCSAPGHTAQPFSAASLRADRARLWQRDLFAETSAELRGLAERHAQIVGWAGAADASAVAPQVEPNSVVFVDPPYARYQYSRFYHVLESLARGWCTEVEGAGRYPPRVERPQSLFSLRTFATDALTQLLASLADRSARVVITFPEAETSSGLSGSAIAQIARTWFRVEVHVVSGTFSTLGGSGEDRPARLTTRECVLVLRPKARSATASH